MIFPFSYGDLGYLRDGDPVARLQGLHGLSSLLLAHDARTERGRVFQCCHGRVTIRM